MATAKDLTAEELAVFRVGAHSRQGAVAVTGRCAVLAGRIRQQLAEIERVVERAERALMAASRRDDNREHFLDSAALSLHNFYAGVERVLEQIASTVEGTVPSTHDRDRDRPRLMTVSVTGLRPPMRSQTAGALNEYRRCRYVVRSVHGFERDPLQIERFSANLRPVFTQVRADLEAFEDVLLGLSDEA
jgi:hypothetical protein